MNGESEVIASPEADAPRAEIGRQLAGDPRGELIELQLQIAHIYRTQGARSQWRAAYLRSQELLKQHASAWAPKLEVRDHAFRRGFVERVTLRPDELVARAPELYAAAPILHLDAVEAASSIRALCESPHAERLRSIDLRNNRIGDAGLETIAASPWLSRLTWLELYGNRITARGLEALAASPNLPSLRWVNLAGNDVDDPADQPAGIDETFINDFASSESGRALEAKHGPKAWLHWRVTETLFWPPDPECFLSGV